jgi:hypothetical protein
MVKPNCAVVTRDVDEISIPKAFAVEGIDVEDVFDMQRLLQGARDPSTYVRNSQEKLAAP